MVAPPPGDRPQPAIATRDLVVRRGGREVLRGLTLSIGAGEITGLLGPSGCGKTTLMRAMVGAQILTSGTVSVLGQEAGSTDLRRRLGYVTQAPSVYPDLTARENLAYFGRPWGVTRADVDDTLRDVGLADSADRPASTLSGGQLSRVCLGAALVSRPEVLILDEPTVGLDPVLRVELWDMFRTLAAGGTTLVVSSHVMDEAARCDRLLFLREGELLAQGTLPELLAATGTTDAEAAFLSLAVGNATPGQAR